MAVVSRYLVVGGAYYDKRRVYICKEIRKEEREAQFVVINLEIASIVTRNIKFSMFNELKLERLPAEKTGELLADTFLALQRQSREQKVEMEIADIARKWLKVIKK